MANLCPMMSCLVISNYVS